VDIRVDKEKSMKKPGAVIAGIGLLISFLYLTPAIAAVRVMTVKMARGEARVGVLIGNAQVISAEKSSARSLNRNDRLYVGDEVATGSGSRLELLLPDSSRVRFSGNTRFRIQEIKYGEHNDSRCIRINVSMGKAWANVSRAVGKQGIFELQSENAVAGVRGAVYRMNVENDQSTLVKVYEGQVHVSGGGKTKSTTPAVMSPPSKIAGPRSVSGPRKVAMEEWTVIVRAMQQISINADGTAGMPSDFVMEEDRDDWVDWNRSRDEIDDSE